MPSSCVMRSRERKGTFFKLASSVVPFSTAGETAVSYARLMRKQGRDGEALEMLKPVHDWFTEGFGTKDLKEANALLDELPSEPA